MGGSSPLRGGHGRRADAAFLAAATVGAALCVVSVMTVAFRAQPDDRGAVALAVAIVVGVPFGVGLWAWSARQYARFGRFLVAAGCVFFVATNAQSDNEVVYSIGRVGIWLTAMALPALLLAFPTRALRSTAERVIVAGLFSVVVLLLLPTVFLVESYPAPVPFASCTNDCPRNAFMVLDHQPAFVRQVVYPMSAAATVLLLLVSWGVLARRLRHATKFGRRTLAPMVALATVAAVLVGSYLLIRRISPTAAALDPIGWGAVLCVPAVAMAFLIGLLRRRFFEAQSLEDLARRLRMHPEAGELRQVLAGVLGDPSLEIAYRGWPPSEWVDDEGHVVGAPRETPRRRVIRIPTDRPVAAILYDSALDEQRDLIAAAGSLALASLENTRLAAQVEASIDELQRSRARIQSAAYDERLRMERDLHEGAQQRLIALRIRLEMAARVAEENPSRGAAILADLGQELEEVLDEVRSLGRGIYPAVLADQGLRAALVAQARREPIPTTVDATDISRYPTEVESAVYFCCLEALQNITKHARGATSAWISLVDDGALRFAVVDDGMGISTENGAGAGITNMTDRLAAVGGTITIRSAPGEGTEVIGKVPLNDRLPRPLSA
jgi:signal transduction histidine kinase